MRPFEFRRPDRLARIGARSADRRSGPAVARQKSATSRERSGRERDPRGVTGRAGR